MRSGAAAVAHAYRQRRLYPGEAIDLELPENFEDLIAFKAEADAVAAAAREVSRLAADHIIAYLGDQGMAKMGPTFYRVQAKRTIKIKREAHSRFWRWVQAHNMAERLFNPNQARTTGLAALKELPDPDTGEIMERKEWDEVFLEVTPIQGQFALDEIPESKMTQWQRRFPEGTIQRGGPIEKGDTGNGDDDESEEPAR